MASKLEQAARDLAQAAIQDTAGGILTQEITTELKAVAAATKSLEKSVDKGSSATSAELARIAKQSQSGLDKLTNSVNELNSLTKAQILQTAIVNLSPGGPCDASAPFNDTLQEFAQACDAAGITIRAFPDEGVRISVAEEEANDRVIDVGKSLV